MLKKLHPVFNIVQLNIISMDSISSKHLKSLLDLIFLNKQEE